MSFPEFPADDLRVSGHFRSHQEEGGFRIVFLQQVQKPRRIPGARAVVKREVDHLFRRFPADENRQILLFSAVGAPGQSGLSGFSGGNHVALCHLRRGRILRVPGNFRKLLSGIQLPGFQRLFLSGIQHDPPGKSDAAVGFLRIPGHGAGMKACSLGVQDDPQQHQCSSC